MPVTMRGPSWIPVIFVGDDVISDISDEISARAARIIAISSYSGIERLSMASYAKPNGPHIDEVDSLLGKRSARSIRETLKDAINQSRDGVERQTFMDVLTAFSMAERVRHQLAHWLWCSSPSYPDALVLLNSDSYMRKASEGNRYYRAAQKNPSTPEPKNLMTMDSKQIIVHDAGTLQAEVTRAERVHGVPGLLQHWLACKDRPHQQGSLLRDWPLRHIQSAAQSRQIGIRPTSRRRRP